ncbi:KTSC domain-containing protein [Nocardioides marmoriginsengisoli]|uniref:KTSC domain-containing protein n=1 Tax=Nocardioides marmoriginsengisoli TaxID=661483 RepID=A0A3N0CFT4_9ACTN|nr:KTSC domain-containing protein [Nocardioides marmoriginsengisoli]RNL62330.1 KTSC domain-containing protein [Nocardioides marmoriginsengisoli]
MEMTPMRRSRALHKVGYDPAERVLRVQFRNSHLYDYLDVGPEVIKGLLESAHPWTEWGPKILEHEVRRVDD